MTGVRPRPYRGLTPVFTRGGTLLHTLIWLALLGGGAGLFYGYLEHQMNPNRAPQMTGAGEIVLKRNRAGHFVAGGAINGHKVNFLVDTGATQIAVPRELADKLGLERGLPVQIQTAAGPSQGYATRLASVELASMRLSGASAIVADGLDPALVLLGMSFLRHVEIAQRGDELILKPLQHR
ncbi:MAG TPA: TIGR02281 family clan AA aspartic protease [Burkholderiales bacterium]|nr:TIGR02281 family clan AA aspartic protease [Burkholderiales bacterium]